MSAIMEENIKRLEVFLSVNVVDEISELDATSKSFLKKCLIDTELLVKTVTIIKIQAIIDYMYEQINIGNWKEVKIFLRKTITIASYLKLLAHLKSYSTISKEIIKEAYKIVDFGIIFGMPLETSPKLLYNCAEILDSINMPLHNMSHITISKNIVNFVVNKSSAKLLETISCPSMEHFYKNNIVTETPVVLTDCVSHWPALHKWKDPNYFIKLAGLRTVSIELGNKYTDADWTQKLMTIEEFIMNHIYKENNLTGYLAQYQLFEHIPELNKDISEPEYCCFTESNEPVHIMAWFGPKGTVSPLHHDPKKNLLVQVVGEKRVFLFSPQDSEYLYPHEHELLHNTARVDPREPDLEKYPNYHHAQPFYCILSPGQMLYIPPKWWHFVESLSTSFSVSFWWD